MKSAAGAVQMQIQIKIMPWNNVKIIIKLSKMLLKSCVFKCLLKFAVEVARQIYTTLCIGLRTAGKNATVCGKNAIGYESSLWPWATALTIS